MSDDVSAHDIPGAAIAPRQQRSMATLISLLDATEGLLDEKNYEEITVADIVARAGSSVGSFYARFHTKEAILIAVLERYQSQSEKAVAQLLESDEWARLDLEGRFRHLVQFGVSECRRRRGLLQMRLRRRITPGHGTLPDQNQRDQQIVAGFRLLFEPVHEEIDHPDWERALTFALRILNGVVLTTILLDDASSAFGPISDQELTDRLVSTVTGYLVGR